MTVNPLNSYFITVEHTLKQNDKINNFNNKMNIITLTI